MNANPILHQKKYARIVELFASKKKISIDKALGIFYHSEVYQLMRDGISDMHCMSDSYLEKELEMECEKKLEQAEDDENKYLNFYYDRKNELPDYQRAICGIVRNSNQYFELIDDEGIGIWKSNSEINLTSALSKKSKKYYKHYNGEFPDYRIWIIGTKKENDTIWNYRNVASCCRWSFNGEINAHIRQLIKEQNNEKGRRYFNLWNNKVNKIAFFEILIDRYIEHLKKTQEIQESFLSSIILPTGEVQDSNIVKILNKNRSSFIEGKLAAENNMKYVKGEENGGIWFPSGVGIDGDIYNYYCKKTIFDDM